MNWEDTIVYLRTSASYRDILRDSYLEEDLIENANRFEQSEEFKETLRKLKEYNIPGNKLLDVGAGNGIATVAFSRNGYAVTAIEPDPSALVGAGAIRKLINELSLREAEVVISSAERMPFPDNTFDIVYVRQAMHHAFNLKHFIRECARVLKPGGVLFTVRDHVIYDKTDKKRFFKEHPLHKYYGGENAYTAQEYGAAMTAAGLHISTVLKHFDSIINYFPQTVDEIAALPDQFRKKLNKRVIQKFGKIGKIALFSYIYRKAAALKFGGALDEKRIPGRLYTYIATKPKMTS